MILFLQPGSQKKMRLTQPHCPCGFHCFLLPSKSVHLFTDFKPDTIRGSTFKRHWILSCWVRMKTPWTSLTEAAVGVQALFGLQGCHRVTQTRYQKRWQECPPQGTPATHEKKQQLLWDPSATSVEPTAVSFRRFSPGSPWKGLLGAPFSRPPGNRCLQIGQEQKQEEKKQLILEAAEGFLLTCFGIIVRQVLYVFSYIAVKVPLALFISIEIVFPNSFQHGTLQNACSKSS